MARRLRPEGPEPTTAPAPDLEENNKLLASASLDLVAKAHTALSASAFGVALVIGVLLHYQKVVKNQWYTYPEEWLPSVSATIGDWFPERNAFQLLIALTSGESKTLLLVGFSYLLARRSGTSLPGFIASCGIIRTIACGGWVYITSSDHGDAHDFFMILYIVLCIPWMFGTISLTSSAHSTLRQKRQLIALAFFGALPPLGYFYIQHKVHRVAGAYSIYAIFEWGLIVADVAFDGLAIGELGRLGVQIVDRGDDVGSAPLYIAPPLSSAKSGPYALEKHWVWLVSQTSTGRHLAADSYLAFLYWTNLTALGPMIFYSSVWAMGLSGEEVLIFCTMSPILLAIGPLRRLAQAVPAVFQVASLIGIEAYKRHDLGEQRLRAVAAALAISTLGYTAQWSAAVRRPGELEKHVTTFGIGLLLSVLIKHWNYSLNPVWPIMRPASPDSLDTGGWNPLALNIGYVAALEAIFRSRAPKSVRPLTQIRASLPAAAIGFGGVFFLLHFLFTDAGTVISWTWEGYPIRGPTAMPHGWFVIATLACGFASPHLPPVRLYLASVVSSIVLYSMKSWPAFLGGLVLAFSTSALLRHLTAGAARHSPALTFGLSFLVYAILELASVITTAYAFVPGGVYLRERTDAVLGATVLAIGFGVYNVHRSEKSISDKEREKEKLTADSSTLRSFRKHATGAYVGILMLSVAAVVVRERLEVPMPYHPEERLVTASIWTMHFALDGWMWESQRRIANIIKDAEIDIMGFLESDLQHIVMGNRDITQYIASELGYYADIGPSPSTHTWGCALLSKFPIINSTHLLLPSPAGELAPAIRATLDIYGELVDVIVAHNGQEEDPLDRELQSTELAKQMRVDAAGRPVIFLGYVVTKPGAERPAPYKILVEDGQMLDVDPTDSDRWCEYILYRGLHRVAYARLNRGSDPAITDTELQLAKFVVPFANATDARPEPSQVEDSVFLREDLRSRTAPLTIDLSGGHRVPEYLAVPGHRFPKQFYGEGERGHRYHVLEDEKGTFGPWYYLEKEQEDAMKKGYVPPECHVQ